MKTDDLCIHYSAISLHSEKHFDFQVDDHFFRRYPDAPVQHGLVDIHVIVIRQARMISLNIRFHGVIELCCDRCLENFGFPIEGEERLIVKFGGRNDETTDDLIIIPEDQGSIDLSHQVYELISLQIPMKRVHQEANGKGGCSPEFLELLKKHSTDVNTSPKPSPDARWSALKGLINGN